MSTPAPPERRTLPAVSAWRGGHCWECDLPVTDEQAIIWDGRIWHVEHWPGEQPADQACERPTSSVRETG